MKFFLIFLFLFLAIAIESTIFPIPLVLMVVIFFGIFQKKELGFFFAILAGIFLDSLTFRTIGVSSIFFLIIVGTLFLYARKFEIHHSLFLVTFTLSASIVYILFFKTSQILSLITPTILCIVILSFTLSIIQKRYQIELLKKER